MSCVLYAVYCVGILFLSFTRNFFVCQMVLLLLVLFVCYVLFCLTCGFGTLMIRFFSLLLSLFPFILLFTLWQWNRCTSSLKKRSPYYIPFIVFVIREFKFVNKQTSEQNKNCCTSLCSVFEFVNTYSI